jgi:hypothetical protein
VEFFGIFIKEIRPTNQFLFSPKQFYFSIIEVCTQQPQYSFGCQTRKINELIFLKDIILLKTYEASR